MAPPEQTEPPPQRSKKAVAMFLMGGALLGKALGFVREIIMAQIVGVAIVADGFRAAISAILLPLAFLQNESVPAILIPMVKSAQRRGDAPRQLACMTLALTAISVLIMVMMLLFGDLLVRAMVAGFTPEGQRLTLHFVHIMSLSMPASVVLNCLAAGEIALGKTRIANLRASVLNVGVIVGLGFFVLTDYAYAIGWSYMIALNLLAAWGCRRLAQEGHLTFSGVTVRSVVRSGKEFLYNLRPFLLLPGFEQANIWLERLFASRIATGAVASLDYARTLTESSLLLLSQPIGLALLGDTHERSEKEQAEALARPLLAAAVPLSVFVFMFAEDIVRLIFNRGAFGEHGVVLTSSALSGIALGLWASTLGWILLRLLNRANRNIAAGFILTCAYAVNIGVNLVLQSFEHENSTGIFLMGVGETGRALVLLGGVVIALGCFSTFARLTLIAVAPGLLMAAIAWSIEQWLPPSLARLALGGGALILCTAVAGWVLCPGLMRQAFQQFLKLASKKRGA